MAASAKPGALPTEVREFFAAKKARPSFSYEDVWREEHVAAFAVAKATEQSIVDLFRDHVQKALEGGLPYEQFARTITPRLQEAGWWGRKQVTDPETGEITHAQLGSPARLKLIIQTNTRTARAAGQWTRIERSKAVLPFLRYRQGSAARHRPDHEAIAERPTILPVDHPYWTFAYPPNRYGCVCWVEQMTKADRAKQPPTPEPDMEPIEVVNKRTGKSTITIRGIDPTFAFNPGKDRFAGLRAAGIKVPPQARQARTATKKTAAPVAETGATPPAADIKKFQEIIAAKSQTSRMRTRQLTRDFINKGLGIRSGLQVVETDTQGIEVGIDQEGCQGMRYGDGSITLSQDSWDAVNRGNLGGVRVLVHEQLHGYGPGNGVKSYKKHGMVVEEITTEILARHLLGISKRTAVNPKDPTGADLGSYQDEIDSARGLILTHTKISDTDIDQRMVEAAISYKQDRNDAPDPDTLADKFVKGLKLPATEETALLQAMKKKLRMIP